MASGAPPALCATRRGHRMQKARGNVVSLPLHLPCNPRHPSPAIAALRSAHLNPLLSLPQQHLTPNVAAQQPRAHWPTPAGPPALRCCPHAQGALPALRSASAARTQRTRHAQRARHAQHVMHSARFMPSVHFMHSTQRFTRWPPRSGTRCARRRRPRRSSRPPRPQRCPQGDASRSTPPAPAGGRDGGGQERGRGGLALPF